MPLGFSNKAVNTVALVTASAVLATSLGLGAVGVFRTIRDVSKSTYDQKIDCWGTGSGVNLSGNSGVLLINRQQKGCIDINGSLSISGSYTNRALSNNNTITQAWKTKDGRPSGHITGSGNLNLSGSLLAEEDITAQDDIISLDLVFAGGDVVSEGNAFVDGSVVSKTAVSGSTFYTSRATPANSAFCRLAGGQVGYCSDAVGAGGTCTCN